MSAPKFIAVGTIALFATIGVIAMAKKGSDKSQVAEGQPVEYVSDLPEPSPAAITSSSEVEETLDRVRYFFTTSKKRLPIVETISYKSRVEWLQEGRPAWIGDYAREYATSRHFIARSLNGKADYYTQKVATGNRFNVFRKDRPVEFHLVIDADQCKMRFYYYDVRSDERVLLKTYPVGLGRFDDDASSGMLTPIGKYKLGEKVATYKPGTMGYFQDQRTEMIQVFGTRWIPFEEEIGECTEDPHGYGLHGAPWLPNSETGELIEDAQCVGEYSSDGCIRLLQKDIEEIFAIVVTKPTYVEIVKDFKEAKLPGVESPDYPDTQ